MARPSRIEYPIALYNMKAQGNEKGITSKVNSSLCTIDFQKKYTTLIGCAKLFAPVRI